MPNWCENRLRIFGPQADIEKFQQLAVGHPPWLNEQERQTNQPSPLNFHSLLPVPAEIINLGTELEKWQLDYWGTKWEAAEVLLLDASATGLSYQFDTAWSPPIALFKSIGPQWPTLTFRLNYEELGCGFIGLCKVVGDNCVDECFNVNGRA
jgi:hypothetical protein